MFRSFLLPSLQSLCGGLHVEVPSRVSESADQVCGFHPQLKECRGQLGHEDIRHHPALRRRKEARYAEAGLDKTDGCQTTTDINKTQKRRAHIYQHEQPCTKDGKRQTPTDKRVRRLMPSTTIVAPSVTRRFPPYHTL